MKKAKMTFMAILASFAMVGAGAAVTFVANPAAIVETKAASVTVNISERAQTLGWSNGVAYSGWKDTSGLFTFTQVGGGNNGKYYNSDKTWRFYNGGSMVISYGANCNVTAVTTNPAATFSPGANKHTASFTETTKIESITIEYTVSQAGTLNSIALSGEYKTEFFQGDDFDHDGMVVTASYINPTSQANVTDQVTFSGYDMDTLGEQTVTVSYTESAITKTQQYQINVVEKPAVDGFDLSTIKDFDSWGSSYGAHNLTSASFSPSVDISANLDFLITNKQSSGVGSEYPCIGAKTTSEMECLRFTLNEAQKKISFVSIVFVTRYNKTYPSLYLHKGAGIASEALTSVTMKGSAETEVVLELSNLNDTTFTVGYNANQTSDNGGVGIKSIEIALVDVEEFGTLDHIKVTSLPNTIYHVGEAYDSTGFAVTAYDGKDEATANFKDVTASVTQTLVNGYEFKDTDVPGFDETVQYTESEKVVETSYHVSVYALAQYRLVTSAPANWAGNYLIVGENADKDVCAMNGALTNPDVESGYKIVEPADGIIETGQELQWTIAAYDDGYSIQGKSGKFIGSLAAASNGMLVSAEALKNTLSYSAGSSVITGTNGYGLTLNTTGDRFRYYSGGTVQLYKLIESDAADLYAQSFLDTLSTGGSAVCQYNPSTGAVTTDLNALKAAWASLAEQYDTALTPAEKEQFRLGAASVEGSNIQKALALYDHIASAYGEKLESGSLTNFDFMNRGIVSGTLGIGAGVLAGNNTAIILIALFSAATIAVVGGILFAKKHKKKAE